MAAQPKTVAFPALLRGLSDAGYRIDEAKVQAWSDAGLLGPRAGRRLSCTDRLTSQQARRIRLILDVERNVFGDPTIGHLCFRLAYDGAADVPLTPLLEYLDDCIRHAFIFSERARAEAELEPERMQSIGPSAAAARIADQILRDSRFVSGEREALRRLVSAASVLFVRSILRREAPHGYTRPSKLMSFDMIDDDAMAMKMIADAAKIIGAAKNLLEPPVSPARVWSDLLRESAVTRPDQVMPAIQHVAGSLRALETWYPALKNGWFPQRNGLPTGEGLSNAFIPLLPPVLCVAALVADEATRVGRTTSMSPEPQSAASLTEQLFHMCLDRTPGA